MAKTKTPGMTPDPERAGHWIDEEGNVFSVGQEPEPVSLETPELDILKAENSGLKAKVEELQMQVNSLSSQLQHAQNATHASAGTD